ncbi:MAG: hypothetical protein LV479_00545 [Methylacidiphilales bacterium]|nr:hypothetical protein [Candidatus Methylacidiphilales bacterium]
MSGQGGTVTGEIVGLAGSGASTPSEIIIFTQPSGYPIAPESLLANGYGFYPGDNLFTVSGGNIVAADVGIYKSVAGGYQGYAFDLNDPSIGYANANGIYLTTTSGGIIKSNANTLGFAGAAYTAVPEPKHEITLLIVAIGGFILIDLFQKIPMGQRISLRRHSRKYRRRMRK